MCGESFMGDPVDEEAIANCLVMHRKNCSAAAGKLTDDTLDQVTILGIFTTDDCRVVILQVDSPGEKGVGFTETICNTVSADEDGFTYSGCDEPHVHPICQ